MKRSRLTEKPIPKRLSVAKSSARLGRCSTAPVRWAWAPAESARWAALSRRLRVPLWALRRPLGPSLGAESLPLLVEAPRRV